MTIIWQAFLHSDVLGQAIVVLLLVLSVFTVARMSWKRGVLGEAKKRDGGFVRRYRQCSHPAQLSVRAANGFVGNMPMADIYQDAVKELLHHLRGRGVADGDLLAWPADRTGPALPESEMASVRAAAEGSLSKRLLALEDGMTFLATCTSCAPSLGLFGTVWGIMRAFMDMVSGGGSINLSTVAPGIASALLTTVAGLFVSIPCSVGYNMLSEAVRHRTVELENFTDGLLADILRVHGASAAQTGASPAPAPVVIQTAPAYPHYPAPSAVPPATSVAPYPAAVPYPPPPVQYVPPPQKAI